MLSILDFGINEALRKAKPLATEKIVDPITGKPIWVVKDPIFIIKRPGRPVQPRARPAASPPGTKP